MNDSTHEHQIDLNARCFLNERVTTFKMCFWGEKIKGKTLLRGRRISKRVMIGEVMIKNKKGKYWISNQTRSFPPLWDGITWGILGKVREEDREGGISWEVRLGMY